MTNDDSEKGEASAHNQGTASGEDKLAVQLGELARAMQQEEKADDLLAVMVQAALQLIPGADEGSISEVVGRKQVGSRAPSGELPEKVDGFQSETGQGPCLDAVYEQQTVRVPDLENEDRWPRFSKLASEAGAKSMLSFQLYVEGDNLGALNLYSRRSNAFNDESEHVGLLVASHAAVAFAEIQKTDQLTQALNTRDLIGQAKGILMERHKITGQQAFVVLTRASQNANLKLRDVAENLVNSGALPS